MARLTPKQEQHINRTLENACGKCKQPVRRHYCERCDEPVYQCGCPESRHKHAH